HHVRAQYLVRSERGLHDGSWRSPARFRSIFYAHDRVEGWKRVFDRKLYVRWDRDRSGHGRLFPGRGFAISPGQSESAEPESEHRLGVCTGHLEAHAQTDHDVWREVESVLRAGISAGRPVQLQLAAILRRPAQH